MQGGVGASAGWSRCRVGLGLVLGGADARWGNLKGREGGDPSARLACMAEVINLFPIPLALLLTFFEC